MEKRTFLKLSSVMMAGTALTPLIDFAQDGKLTNWAGNYTYSTSSLLRASSVEDARSLVKRYDRLKVLGTRHCFNNIADSRDHLLSLAALNKVISLDEQRHTVTVEPGIRYGELAVFLNDKGYALHNLASLPHISVAGGCITATHGSGVHNANLSSAVTALELINAAGDTVSFFPRQEQRVVHRGRGQPGRSGCPRENHACHSAYLPGEPICLCKPPHAAAGTSF